MPPTQLVLARPGGGSVAAGLRLLSLQARARVDTRSALALSLLSGLAYAAAFPPLSFSLLAWVSLAPLLAACGSLSPARAAVAGMCWTVAVGAGAVWFMPGMLSGYFGVAAPWNWLGAAAIVVVPGTYISAYAAWVAWLVRRRAAHPLLLAGGWVVCEIGRAHVIFAIPWVLAAYSQLGWTPLIQIADLAGPYGIGALIAAVNAMVAAAFVPSLRGRRPMSSLGAVAALFLLVLLYGEWRLGEEPAHGPATGVAVVQAGAASASETAATRLSRYVELSRAAANDATQLIVWPEHAIDAYLEEASPARRAVLGVGPATGADLVLGGPHFESTAFGTRYHNSIYLVRQGRLAARYDKHHLVPFAEEARLEWLVAPGANHYTSGDGSFVLPSSELRLGGLLCFEAMFPELARRAVDDGAEVLVNLSNDAWFGETAPARQQLDIAALRAVENRRYLVRAASTGISAVIDPHGRTLAESEFGTHEVLHASVRASRVRTFYQRFGDAFAWVVAAAVLLATLKSFPSSASIRVIRGKFSRAENPSQSEVP